MKKKVFRLKGVVQALKLRFFKKCTFQGGYYSCSNLRKKGKIMHWYDQCQNKHTRVGYLQRWESLRVVLAGYKA